MMRVFEFETELENNVAPHRAPVVTRWGGVLKGKRELAYIADLSQKIKNQVDINFEPFGEVPLSISYTFGFMPAKSWTKKKKKEAFDNKWVVAKPDLDNVMKSTTDVLMDTHIITDDQYLVHYKNIQKIYTEKPYIKIHIEEIN